MATAGTNLSAFNPQELPSAKGKRFGLVVAEWNAQITENLFKGAEHVLLSCGAAADNIVRLNVPGTFELPYGAKLLCQQGDFDAIVVIGTVIQGETRHFDFVCQGVTQGVMQLNMEYNTPVIFCVLTDNTLQQSIDRAGGKHGNKGIECAVAALKMTALKA
jgi:6,7-dimethyl-8-ribityllumazine synthase